MYARRSLSHLSRLLAAAAALTSAACERITDPPAAPPPSLAAAAGDPAPFYYYQGTRIELARDPSRVVVATPAADAATVARELLGARRESVRGARPVGTAGNLSVIELESLSEGEAAALAGALRADRRVSFASNAFRTLAGGDDVLPLDRLAVQFKAGASPAQIDGMLNAFGLRVLRAPQPQLGAGYYVLSYPPGASPLAVAARVSEHPLVAWADPDKSTNRRRAVVPTDSYYPHQFFLKNSRTLNGVAVDINVEPAWDLTKGGWSPASGGLKVGVIGDGVEETHFDLAGRVLAGYDAVLGNGNYTTGCVDCANNPFGNDSHETHVAGIIAAEHDNGRGVAGIAPHALIVPARIFRGDAYAGDIGAADAINYTWYAKSSVVVNNSWGCGAPSNAITNAINDGATRGRNYAGTVFVFAGGNTSVRAMNHIGAVCYPATLPAVIAVGAINKDGGVTDYSPEGPELDIVAPSGHFTSRCVGEVVTVDLFASRGCNDGPNADIDFTSTFSGTSAAAPQVAGVVAMMIARDPTIPLSTVKSRLYAAADPWGPATRFGVGKLNAFKAVTNVAVSISGTSTIKRSGTYTWNASATGGNGSYTYRWERSNDGGPYYFVGTGSSYTSYVDVWSIMYRIDFRVTATSGPETGVGTYRSNIVVPR